MMPPTNKRLAAGNDQLDRLSNLPKEILHSILDFMPASDAARTSILSRSWRYIWMAHPNLVFNLSLYDKIMRTKGTQDEFFHVINKILLLHIGNIAKFKLYIPPPKEGNPSWSIDHWIRFLSRNGIEELELTNTYSNDKNPYKLPSCIICCPTLTSLVANYCIFEPPKSGEAFQKLSRLTFRRVTFGPSFANSVLKIPLLNYFQMKSCVGIHYLNVHIPNIKLLLVNHCRDFDLSCFKTETSLKVIIVNSAPRERISTPMVLDKWPRLRWLEVHSSLLESPDDDFNPKSLAKKADHLRVLQLCWLNFADSKQISSTLCLLRRATNLISLVIQIDHYVVSRDEEIVLKHYLTPGVFQDLNLQELKFVVIYYFEGSGAELRFIKLLLAHSPSLRRIIIQQSSSLSGSSDEELRVLRELMQFPRASQVAELKCARFIKDTSATNMLEIPGNTISRAILKFERMIMKSL